MKILFLAHRIPYPPDKGDKIRAYSVLSYLASRYEVHLACLVDRTRDLRAAEELRAAIPNLTYERLRELPQCLRMVKALIGGTPLTVSYFYSPALQRRVDALMRRVDFDALFVYSSSMAQYTWGLKVPRRVIDFCDLDSEKFRQYARRCRPPLSWLYEVEAKKLNVYEKRLAAHFDHIIFIGDGEKELFESDGFSHKIRVMGNGVDFERYYGRKLPARLPSPPGGKPYLLFTGAMDYLPNVDAAGWFAREVFPYLKMIVPELQFYIMGNHPVRAIRRLHNPAKSIYVTGYLEDLRPYIKSARVFVAPMRIARGMQTKILEAMACGVPVITSPAAARGIGARPGKELLVAETAPEYVRWTLRLLFNDQLRERLRKQAFRFLQECFDWERNLQLLDSLLNGTSVDGHDGLPIDGTNSRHRKREAMPA